MAGVLNPLKNENILFYLDDIMIPGKDWFTLRERFGTVDIPDKGIQPNKNKLRTIVEFLVPTSFASVRQFLGLEGFFRRFVCKSAEIVTPLYEMLKKSLEFKWTTKCI